MGDLKPLGSEKLNGDEKLKRILELTYYNNNKNNTASQKAEYISESNTGVYGVVREKDGYYVKRGLNEGSLDYIGGMFMKNKNKFSSYAEALKRLELLKGQEMLQEDTKYVLKMNKPSTENEAAPMPPAPAAAAPVPTEMPPAPAEVAAEMPPALPPADGDMGMGDEAMPPAPEEGGEDAPEEGDDKMKLIQKLTGKLGQKIRDIQDELESDDIKYILNSVISAVNLDKLDADDKEEILSTFEDDEEGMGDDEGLGLGDEGDAEVPAEMPTAEPEGDLGEVDGIDALENLVNMNFDEGFDDFDTQIHPEELHHDEEEPIAHHDALDGDGVDLEKEKVRKKTKHYVEPDSEEDMYYRQASMDSAGDYESDADLFGDDEYGDMFNFDLKEEDPTGDGGSLSDLYGDEIDNIKSQDFYSNDNETGDEEVSAEPETITKEFDINELTDIINNSVKETLRKHFE